MKHHLPSTVSLSLLALLFLAVASAVYATSENPVAATNDGEEGELFQTSSVTAYTDHAAWGAAAGATTLIDFEAFASGTQITTQLAASCITLVTGSSPNASPPGPVNVFVTSSANLPFPMFTAGLLPSEPNFLSNDLNAPVYATGSTTFEMAGPTTAIGAYVADSSPLDGFNIEVFDGGTSLGTITVPARTLPNSFVGIVSDQAFNKATFYSTSIYDSWGLDNVEHNCSGANATEPSTWGSVKDLFR